MPVTAQDRCDGCGAQAMWSTWIELTEMLWCNSHFRLWETGLREKATLVVDHTYQFEWMRPTAHHTRTEPEDED